MKSRAYMRGAVVMTADYYDPVVVVEMSRRVHSPSKTGVNALNDALWRHPGSISRAKRQVTSLRRAS
jgi:hypothetical protein